MKQQLDSRHTLMLVGTQQKGSKKVIMKCTFNRNPTLMKNTLEKGRSYMDVLFIYIVNIKEFTELFGCQQKEAMIVPGRFPGG